MCSASVLSLTADFSQPIHIHADHQMIDIIKNIATATGNVLVTQGSIKLTADKIILNRPGGDNQKIFIDADGSLTTFYQMQENGKPIKGHAKQIHYELNTNKVELNGNAYLEQLNSNIQCDHLIYRIKENKIDAIGQNGHRITSTLIPSQLKK
nr:lipopolysaccharide transport periplasmic protein LptA [Candidatus Erwinia haradaeae]